MPADLPGAVLFACSHNSVRSPMAENIMRYLYGRVVYVQSCGVRPEDVDPFVVTVMDEIGIDAAKHKPRSFDDLEDSSFDLVISLSPEAHHRALEMTRTMAIDTEYWPTLDPSATAGSREQILDSYRQVRDSLMKQIKARFGTMSAPGV
jgi:protein-tyrosine-phosphatase